MKIAIILQLVSHLNTEIYLKIGKKTEILATGY